MCRSLHPLGLFFFGVPFHDFPFPCPRVVSGNSVSEVTQIIERARDGDSQAAAELLPIVYDELRRLAAHRMAAESGTHTLQPTALVHEAWLRLTTAKEQREFTGRAHFFCAAAEAMRRILIEHARQRLAAKRGGGVAHLDVDEIE